MPEQCKYHPRHFFFFFFPDFFFPDFFFPPPPPAPPGLRIAQSHPSVSKTTYSIDQRGHKRMECFTNR